MIESISISFFVGETISMTERFLGDSVVLQCHNPDAIDHVFRWKKNDVVLVDQFSSNLLIASANITDAGWYTCENGPYTSRIELSFAPNVASATRGCSIIPLIATTLSLFFALFL